MALRLNTLSELVERYKRPVTSVGLVPSARAEQPEFGVLQIAWLTILPGGRITLADQLVNPERAVAERFRQQTGLLHEDLADKPRWPELQQALERKADHLLLGFNLERDVFAPLRAEMVRHGRPLPEFPYAQDVHQWAGVARGKARLSLKDLCQACGVPASRTGDGDSARDRAIDSAALANELLFVHGAQMVQAQGMRPALAGDRAATQRVNARHAADEIKRGGFHGLRDLAYRLRLKVAATSFALADALEENLIPAEAIRDRVANQAIRLALPRARAQAWGRERSGKLKPLKEAMEGLGVKPVCYVQLRIALEDERHAVDHRVSV